MFGGEVEVNTSTLWRLLHPEVKIKNGAANRTAVFMGMMISI